jgi:hypothetical protein
MENSKNNQQVSVFVSVIRADGEVTTMRDAYVVDVMSEEDAKQVIKEHIDNYKYIKNWVGGVVEKAKVMTLKEGTLLYFEEMPDIPKEFNHLLNE